MSVECDYGIEVYKGNAEQLRQLAPALYDVKHVAKENHIAADFFFFDSNDTLRGLYFIVSPDEKHLDELRERRGDIRFLIEQDAKKSPHQINPHYNIIPIANVTWENYFQIHTEMLRAVQDVALVTYCFGEFGYHIPKEMSRQTVWNFYHFLERSRRPSYTEAERETYAEIFKGVVADAYQMYSKDEGMPDAKVMPLKNKHAVDEQYFIRNSIPATYDVVTEKFFDFILDNLDRVPEFIYYKEKKPYIKIRDHEKAWKGDPNRNLWKGMTGEKRYRIGFPTCQAHMFYSLMQRYNCLSYDGQQPESKFLFRYPQYITRVIDTRDLYNVNSLCKANKIPYAINYGSLHPVTCEETFKAVLMFRAMDEKMVNAITNRLATERSQYFPASIRMITETEERKLPYRNPYMDDAPPPAIPPQSPEPEEDVDLDKISPTIRSRINGIDR